MLKIKILVVGTVKENYFKEAIIEYKKRLSRFAIVEVQEVQEYLCLSKTSDEKIKDAECSRLESCFEGFVIALDKGGAMVTSEELASIIENASSAGNSKITFVIGGSLGLTKDLLKKVNKVISFGKITYPHQLMRVILFEQIYRAETIINNITYHK